MPAAYNCETINDNEMKFGGVVKDHSLINLVWFNCRMTLTLHHNDVTNVKNFELLQNFHQSKKKSLETFLN